MSKIYTNLKTVKLVNYPIKNENWVQHLDGHAILDLKSNELVRMGNNGPYIPAGGKKACDQIVASGLIGEPLIYRSNEKQKAQIVST